jgi:hypothetical protein
MGQIEGQSQLFEFTGSNAGDSFGRAVAVAGDVDGDGISDVAVGAPGAASGAGALTVLSGANGSLIREVPGTVAGEQLGLLVAGLGDISGDGKGDVLVAGVTTALVISGGDGSVIHSVTPAASPIHDIAATGDVSNDGIPDFAISDPTAAYTYSGATGNLLDTFPAQPWTVKTSVTGVGDVNTDGWGDVTVVDAAPSTGPPAEVATYSGQTGSQIWSFAATQGLTQYNMTSIDSCGDGNGDGIGDFVVGNPLERIASSYSGFLVTYSGATLYSGADGSPIQIVIRPEFPTSTNYTHNYGTSVSGVGDVDGDGDEDIMFGSEHDSTTTMDTDEGSVILYSGRTGLRIFEMLGKNPGDHFGAYSDGYGDFNQDGRHDIVVGAHGVDLGGIDAGAVYVYSVENLPLTTDVHDVSVSGQGTQTFSLDAGPTYANLVYLVAGSLSGISPGVPFGSVVVPLNIDGYALFTVSQPGVLPLVNTLGILDGSGQGSAAFTIPPGASASLAGLTLHHAFVVLDQTAGGVAVFASNAAPLTTSP